MQCDFMCFCKSLKGKEESVMKNNLRVKHVVLAVLLAVSLTACGGGGDGGGGSPAGISYTGLTTQATIDENNAEDLSTGAYQGGQTGAAFSGVGAIQAGESGPVGRPRMLKVSQILGDALYKMDLTSISGGTFVGAIHTESITFYGDYGGSASGTININEQTGEFSGSITFNSYSDDGVTTISGDTSFSGQVDPDTEELIEFNFSFDNLTVTSGSDSFTVDGNISFDLTVSPGTMTMTMTMTMLLKDNNTGKVYKVENYTMTLTKEVNYVDVEVSGKFFDPDYGYVFITTTAPLCIYDGDDYPSDGVLVVTGNTGIGGGSTMARLTALSSTTYQVEADTNGDGTYDWNSGVLNWSDL
jgi:hypothetical protein